MPILTFIFLLFLLAAQGFFSATETALFSLTKLEKRRLKERHPSLGRWVHEHLEHPRRTLASLLIGNTLVDTLASAILALFALHAWGPGGMSLALAVFAVVLVVVGEVIPKALAVRYNEFFSMTGAIPLRIFSVFIFPVRWLTRLVTDRIVSFLIHEHKEHPDQISEEELKTLVRMGEEEALADRQEWQMLRKFFELGERPARSIMTPRVDVKALDIEDPPEKHLEMIRQYHYTHFPVFRESVDNILGVIAVQDYVLSSERKLESFLQEPLYVPQTKLVDELYSEMKSQNRPFAVCVDEYGGTAGIITLEDILEEIFGEYYDEYARVENPIRPHGVGEYRVDAKIPLTDFNDYFTSQLVSEEASTLGGYLLEKLGAVPQKGAVVKAEGLEMRVEDVVRKRQIRTVLVRFQP